MISRSNGRYYGMGQDSRLMLLDARTPRLVEPIKMPTQYTMQDESSQAQEIVSSGSGLTTRDMSAPVTDIRTVDATRTSAKLFQAESPPEVPISIPVDQSTMNVAYQAESAPPPPPPPVDTRSTYQEKNLFPVVDQSTMNVAYQAEVPSSVDRSTPATYFPSSDVMSVDVLAPEATASMPVAPAIESPYYAPDRSVPADTTTLAPAAAESYMPSQMTRALTPASPSPDVTPVDPYYAQYYTEKTVVDAYPAGTATPAEEAYVPVQVAPESPYATTAPPPPLPDVKQAYQEQFYQPSGSPVSRLLPAATPTRDSSVQYVPSMSMTVAAPSSAVPPSSTAPMEYVPAGSARTSMAPYETYVDQPLVTTSDPDRRRRMLYIGAGVLGVIAIGGTIYYFAKKKENR